MHLDIAPLLVACQDRPVEFASYHYEGLWVRQVPNRQDPTDVYFQMDFVKFDYTKPPSTTTIADAKTGPTSTPMTVETAKFHYRRHVRLHHGHT